MPQVVSLSFFRLPTRRARLWALWMMAAGRRRLARTPDIGFWKLCGSGGGHGFTPRIDIDVIAILATWPSEEIARERVDTAPVFQRYRHRASETWSLFMTATEARGQWSGRAPFESDAAPMSAPGEGPIAALTRATLRPSILKRFWRRVPNISETIGADPNVTFKIGIGELPLIQQVTFSIWPDAKSMAAFARTGLHAQAIRAVRDEGWFREELYARFRLLSESGTWGGTSPIAGLDLT